MSYFDTISDNVLVKAFNISIMTAPSFVASEMAKLDVTPEPSLKISTIAQDIRRWGERADPIVEILEDKCKTTIIDLSDPGDSPYVLIRTFVEQVEEVRSREES